MDETKSTRAIILDRRPYRESDSLVTVYTRKFGKQILVARGTKKLQSKLAGHLEPISLADIMIVRGKNFDYIGGAAGQDAYASLKNDLNKLYFVGRAVGWFNRLVKENQADERLFFLLGEWLKAMDNFSDGANPAGENKFNKESGELLFSFFALKLLVELGYQPEITNCLVCRQALKPGNNYFDLKNGGVIGGECWLEEQPRREHANNEILIISDNCLKIMRFILSHELKSAVKLKVDNKSVRELSVFITHFLEFSD